MSRVISIINLKGGVGKTTCTVAIAEFLAEDHNQKTLVVDLDPQTNSTIALIPEKRWEDLDSRGLTLKQLFLDKLKGTCTFDIKSAIVNRVSNLHGGIENLSLLPSSLGLIEIQDQLALIPGGSMYSVSPVNILQNALHPVINNYDYVIIDCPPNLGIITLNGISISHGYIIPVIPDVLSTYGIPQILERLESFAHTNALSIPPMGIIVSKFRAQSPTHRSRIQQLRNESAQGKLPPIFDTTIPEAGQIAEAADVGLTFNTLRQKYGYGTNYEIYSELVKEFMHKCR